MNILWVLIVGLLLLFWSPMAATTYEGGTRAQRCAAGEDGIDRCGPITVDGKYQLPAEGDVIRSVVHTGPVAPEYQAGYEIVVDAGGTVTITETPPGASGDLSQADRTAEETVRTEEIGADGVQDLLAELETCDFYYLPQRSEFTDRDMPVGGSVSILEVQLADGAWEVSRAVLSGRDGRRFDQCQELLADRFGVTAPD